MERVLAWSEQVSFSSELLHMAAAVTSETVYCDDHTNGDVSY